ncbi:unnamed protein product, partial [Tilletia caries]
SALRPTELVTSLSTISAISDPLGIPWKSEKDVDFCSAPVYIGFTWYIAERCVALPDSKRLKYLAALADWGQQPRQNLRAAQKLFGRLQHASFVVQQGRKRLGYLRRFVASLSHLSPHQRHRPGKQVAKDMAWWTSALSRPDLRRSFAKDDVFDKRFVACDASTTHGIGVVVDGAELFIPVRPGWKSQGRDIAWLEAIALEVTVQLLVDQGLADCRLRVLTDNSSVFFSERSGHNRNASVMEALARIRDLEAAYNIEVVPVLVPSASNPADGPSRGCCTSPAQLRRPSLHPAIRPFFG